MTYFSTFRNMRAKDDTKNKKSKTSGNLHFTP